jgi:hypothetical protein
MGVPSCVVLLREYLNLDEHCGPWLRTLGTMAPDDMIQGIVIEGRPSNFGISDPEEEGVPRIVLRSQDVTESDLIRTVQRATGWTPSRSVNVEGFTSARYNHIFVGRVAVGLAARLQGLIQLRTVCVPEESGSSVLPPEAAGPLRDLVARLHPEDQNDPRSVLLAAESDPSMAPFWKAMNLRSDQKVRTFLEKHPGRFFELLRPDGVVDSYLVDDAFMEHWMKDPQFHIG